LLCVATTGHGVGAVTAVAKCLLLLSGLLLSSLAGVHVAQVAAPDHRAVIDIGFPTVRTAEFRDDYDAGRSAGRAHRGTDLFAPAGSPVHAAQAGTVTWVPGRHASAGYAIHVRGEDGRLYAYYHLGPDAGPASAAYAPGIAEGTAVTRGQVIGYLGDSGNAAGGRAHLHFEIHDDAITDPYGTNRRNPYASLLAALQGGGDVLRTGDRGPAVRAWQEQLVAAGASLGVDGIFGPQTELLTRQFQEARGLPVDGVVGPQTRAAMAVLLADATDTDQVGITEAVPVAHVAVDLPAGTLLRMGDRGSAVARWQEALRASGARLAADGIFGPVTDRATREFQQARGILVDGLVGPQTLRAMAGG
jgi:peptidoglycan hydrolase-like protein with peptidoglycan-binding domain